jgi:hydroxyquinol 1,2-dioxygenase
VTGEATGVVPLLVTEDNLTDLAVQRWGTAHDPRLAELLTALVRHLHEFAREVRLTEDEWMAAIGWLTRTGQMCDEKRQEFILASDVLGLSMLVVQMNHRFDERATPATVLGPFYIEGSPELEYGGDMSDGVDGDPLFVHGTVRDLDGRPVAGAVLDVWQADADGAYEAQLDVDEARLRGRFRSLQDGRYCIRTIAPKGYTIPMDGTVGDLVSRTRISEYRPAHVHFRVDAPGFEPLVTHLFRHGAPYLDTDVVFGTKQQLVVLFEPHEGGATPTGVELDRAWLEARYDVVLQPVNGPVDGLVDRPVDGLVDGATGGRR